MKTKNGKMITAPRTKQDEDRLTEHIGQKMVSYCKNERTESKQA